MPDYQFTVRHGAGAAPLESPHLHDGVAARGELDCLRGKLLKEAGSALWQISGVRIDVANDAGLTLYSMEVVGIEAPASPLPALAWVEYA